MANWSSDQGGGNTKHFGLQQANLLVRQSSSTDVDKLRSNLEASIERENDLKEQLTFAEDEAKTLRHKLRDIEHENEALTKQLNKLSQAYHSHDGKRIGETIQAEVIQLENAQLRERNKELHMDIDNFQSQVKSLNQKIQQVSSEQEKGPLGLDRNSLYYETKFEMMTHEIEDLRWQLQDRENDIKKLKESGSEQRRMQLKRAITLETDTLDPKKQLNMIQQEAEILKEKLCNIEKENEKLVRENRKFQLLASRRRSHDESSEHLLQKVTELERQNAVLLQQLQNGQSVGQQERKLSEMESENSRLLTELSYFTKSKPDLATMLSGLQSREEKILTYEKEISNLKTDMSAMESSLQQDIKSLTVKNSILQELLQAISGHEGGAENGGKVQGSSDEAFIHQHIHRLPAHIQQRFRDKIAHLDQQLLVQREEAVATECLLKQVRERRESYAVTSTKVMLPRRISKYPSPPPSFVLKPSLSDSPSHCCAHHSSHNTGRALTPESRVRWSHPIKTNADGNKHDDCDFDLTVELGKDIHEPLTAETNTNQYLDIGDAGGQIAHTLNPEISLDTAIILSTSNSLQSAVSDVEAQLNSRLIRSGRRQQFFENYSAVIEQALPLFEPSQAAPRSHDFVTTMLRDVSDASISSHLSAASDCTVVDDEAWNRQEVYM